jgi:hypothetical protein
MKKAKSNPAPLKANGAAPGFNTGEGKSKKAVRLQDGKIPITDRRVLTELADWT